MNAAGYLTIVNHSRRGDRLIGAASPAATRVSIHQSRQVGAIMTMRAIPVLDIGGGAQISLAPGGLHLMLGGLRRPLRTGDRVPVSLIFSESGRIAVNLAVRAEGPAMPDMAMSPPRPR
jgi:copper(I)-binding protein